MKRALRPRVWKDIKLTLSELGAPEDIDYNFIKSLFSDLRQLLEASHLKKDFPALNFYCNLLQHTELGNASSLLPLQIFAKMCNNQRIDDWGAGGTLNYIGWPAIVRDGAKLLRGFQLDTKPFIDPDFMFALRANALGAISGKSVHAENLIEGKHGDALINVLKKNRLVFDNFAAIAFEIYELESETNLQVFYHKYTVSEISHVKPKSFGSNLAIGKCMTCGSFRVGPERNVTKQDIENCALPDLICHGCRKKHEFDPWGKNFNT